jgi:diguanylate cyclase (GGDEF)-like protein
VHEGGIAVPAAAERAAWEAHCARRERVAYIACNALIAVLVPIWGLMDRLLAPALAPAFLRLRLLDMLVALGVLVALVFSRNLLRIRLLMLASIVAVGAAVAVMVPLVGAPQSQYVLGLSLIFWGTGMLLPWPMPWTAAALAATMAFYATAHVAQHGTSLSAHGFAGALFYLGSAAVISTVNTGVRLRLQRQAFAASFELARKNELLKELSDTDELTGLCNYRRFVHELEAAFKRSRRGGQPASLLMIDVDHFKRFNDRSGHETGNALLRELASVMQRSIRDVDVLARYGGEEFCAIVLGTREVALRVAERMRADVAGYPFVGRTGQPNGCVSVSIGVAAIEPGDAGSGTVIARADGALYRCKELGRNRVLAA